MSSSDKAPKRLRTPLVGVAIGSTLLMAIAIPLSVRKTEGYESVLALSSPVDGQVLKSLVKPRQFVNRGDVLVQLNSADLEARIAQLRSEVEELRAQNKQVVLDSPFLGTIGSAPRIVYAPQGDISIPKTTEVPKSVTTDNPLRVAAERDLLDFDKKNADVLKQFDSAKGSLSEATRALEVAQSNLDAVSVQRDKAKQELEKQKQLFDAGAIPKKKYDTAASADEAADSEYVAAKKNFDDAQARAQAAKASIDQLGPKAEQIEKERKEREQKLASIPEAVTTTETEKVTTMVPKELPKRRIIFGTAPIGKAEPVGVKLVDADNSALEEKIASKLELIRRLQDQLDLLQIKAPQDGYVVSVIVHPGMLVHAGDKIVQIAEK